MTSCSFPTPEASGLGARNRARSPLVTAVVVSLVTHVIVATSLTGGAGRESRHRFRTPTFTVSIVDTTSLPAPERLEGPDEARTTTETVPAALERRRERPQTRAANASASVSKPAAGAVAEKPDLTYYGTRQLDRYPSLAAALDLRYADQAAAAIAGHALILVLIDATGAVDDVEIMEAEPPGFFEDDIRRAFAVARFTPGVRNGRYVKSRLLVRITYGADDVAR